MNKFLTATVLSAGMLASGASFAMQDRNRCDFDDSGNNCMASIDVVTAGMSWLGPNAINADFGSFQHDYFFTLGSSDLILTGSITEYENANTDITNLVLSFWTNPDGSAIDSGTEQMHWSVNIDDLGGSFTGSLTPGFYSGLGTTSFFYRVTGDVTGSVSGKYALTAQITAVPEPEVWATMALGLGLIGLRLRGRGDRKVSA
ncbi:MAG: PEP-CTERM sorting domain-containing protein [Pseudomonadota bacterium]